MDPHQRRSHLIREGRYLSFQSVDTNNDARDSVNPDQLWKTLPPLPPSEMSDTSTKANSRSTMDSKDLEATGEDLGRALEKMTDLKNVAMPQHVVPGVYDRHPRLAKVMAKMPAVFVDTNQQTLQTYRTNVSIGTKAMYLHPPSAAALETSQRVQDTTSPLELPLRPPPRSFRSSFHQKLSGFSMTPGEMSFPPPTLTQSHHQSRLVAEQTLGLRRQSRLTPPAPLLPTIPRYAPILPPKLPLPKEPFTVETWRQPKEPEVWDRDSRILLHSLAEHHKAELPLPTPNKNVVALAALEGQTLEPQNGKIAWYHALTGFLVIFNCWGLSNAFGLFQAYYGTYMLPHTPPSTIAWIGSTQLALVFGLGLPVGRAVDRGYFRYFFHSGSAIMVAGLLMTAQCTEWWQLFIVQGLVTGFGMGCVFCSGFVCLMDWFDERKLGIALASAAAGSCIGGITYVLIARHFLLSSGFATTIRIMGAVAAVTMIPPNLVFHMRVPRRKVTMKRLSSASFQTPAGLQWSMFLEKSYLLAAAGMFFSFLGVYFGFVYMVSYAAETLKLSVTSSTNLLIFMLAANLPGRFLPGFISDRCIGPLNTIIPAALSSSAVLWLWTTSIISHSSLIVIACFYGFVSAGVQVLYASTVLSFCLEPDSAKLGIEAVSTVPRQVAKDRIGVKSGAVNTCIGLACLIGTPIGGALISYRTKRGLDQPYLWAQVFAGSSLMLGGLFLLASRIAKDGLAAVRA